MHNKSPKFISSEAYGTILTQFLIDVAYEPPSWPCDQSLEEYAISYYRQQHDWTLQDRAHALKMPVSIFLAATRWYPHASKDAKATHSMLASLPLLIEDIARHTGLPLDTFAPRLLADQLQDHPVLQSLTQLLRDLQVHLGPFARSVLLSSTIAFINGTFFEKSYEGRICPPKGATQFPEYLRVLTGIAEPFAHFIFAQKFPESEYLHVYLPVIPNITSILCYVNDIMSFYKESIKGDEQLNFISNVANMRGITYLAALEWTCKQVCDKVGAVRAILREYAGLLEVFEDFLRGYISFHLEQPRYKLEEVLADLASGTKSQTDNRVIKYGA
ncbi:hypothetical protein N0V90_010183 [Kalmusia sp. IMI 367209]|nr:hypothetical protein N0V90_010183 [Kalmusia sp. IMI 367209]